MEDSIEMAKAAEISPLREGSVMIMKKPDSGNQELIVPYKVLCEIQGIEQKAGEDIDDEDGGNEEVVRFDKKLSHVKLVSTINIDHPRVNGISSFPFCQTIGSYEGCC